MQEVDQGFTLTFSGHYPWDLKISTRLIEEHLLSSSLVQPTIGYAATSSSLHLSQSRRRSTNTKHLMLSLNQILQRFTNE